MTWRALPAAIAAILVGVYVAWGQPFQQPGGSTVPPAVQMCFNGITNSDGSRQVVPCGTGGTGTAVTGTSSNAGSGQSPTATNVPTIAYVYGFNGVTWDQLLVDNEQNLKVTTTPQTAGATTQVAVAPTALAFSTLLTPSSTREGCVVQNIGSTLGYVFFGANGSASTPTSFQINTGATISCNNVNGTVLTDNVSWTCNSGTCAFVVSSQ
jgi:hypothetical protein